VASRAARSLAALCAAGLCAGALASCASTVQDAPIPHNLLEYMVLAPYPVYWLGGSFQGLPVSEANHDPSDAWTVNYGNCLEGGEGACVTPLSIVTSPDNGFLPGGSIPTRTVRIRGVDAHLANGGRTIVMPTGGVVLDIYATNARTAAAAALTAVPINQPGAPGQPLPVPAPNTGFGETPLPGQVPSPLRALP
jgi:hypothetical protein